MKPEKKIPSFLLIFLYTIPIVLTTIPIFILTIQSQAILAILFLFIWVYLPGKVYATLLGLKTSKSLGFLSCFFLGLIGLIILFYLGRNSLILKIVPAAIGLFGIIKTTFANKHPINKNALKSKWYSTLKNPLWWVLAFATWWSFYITFSCLQIPTEITNTDYFWHMGNIHTLATSPQFQDIRVLGMTFKYHYFSDLLWACGNIIMGLSPALSITSYPTLITPVLMSFSIWQLVSQVTQTPWKKALASTVILLWVPLYGNYNDYTYQWATNVNAVGIALPCAIWVILLCTKTLNQKQIPVKNILTIILSSALLTGLKGPFALCAFAIIFAGWLLRTIKKNQPCKHSWLVPLSILVGFFPIWYFLLRTGLNEGYISSWQPAYSVYTAEVLAPLLIFFGNGLAARLILLPFHLIIVLGVFSIPFVTACVRFIIQFFKNKLPKNDTINFYLLGSAGCLLVFYMLDLRGRSQFYFLYFSVPFIAVVAINEVKLYWLPKFGKITKKIGVVVVTITIIFSAVHPMIEKPMMLYTQSEVNASLWLANNVANNELIATNRHSAFYMASALSGKQFYLEGDTYARNSGVTQEMLTPARDLNDSLFMPTTENKNMLAKEMGINYLVQFTNNVDADLLAPLDEWYTVVWREDNVTIYKV